MSSGMFALKVLGVATLLWTMLCPLASFPAAAQPHLCTDEVFPPLAAGYAALRAGQNEQAQREFEKVLGIDGFNPFALNNLAVLAEQQGRLKEAMEYLLRAETYAAAYCHQLEEICDVGGLCLAVAPGRGTSAGSSIAAIIHSNINLLKSKIGKSDKPVP